MRVKEFAKLVKTASTGGGKYVPPESFVLSAAVDFTTDQGGGALRAMHNLLKVVLKPNPNSRPNPNPIKGG